MASALYAGPPDDPGIQKHEQNQQERIDQGVKSGELAPGEAGRLEKREAKIKQDEARMKSDGKLTREQNKTSRQIYKDKHNREKTHVS